MDSGIQQTQVQCGLEEPDPHPQGDIVLFKNEPIYKHDLSAARISQLLWRKNGDIYGPTIE